MFHKDSTDCHIGEAGDPIRWKLSVCCYHHRVCHVQSRYPGEEQHCTDIAAAWREGGKVPKVVFAIGEGFDAAKGRAPPGTGSDGGRGAAGEWMLGDSR